MRSAKRREIWFQILVVLAVLLPLVILFLLPGGSLVRGGMWFWLVLLLCFWMLWAFLAAPAAAGKVVEPEPHTLTAGEQPEVVREIMDVRLASDEAGIRVFRGKLLEPAATAYEKLKSSLSGQTMPLLQEDDKFGAAVVLIPRQVGEATLEQPVRPWVHWLLFGLTIVTTTWAGAAQQGVNILERPQDFTLGLPYALALLAILGVHEMGHYFMARRHGMRVTPPYFIPVPFALGTFGAFIQMRSPPENRRVLFDVAVAGPLAGLFVAVPLLFIGLQTSEILPAPPVVGDQVTAPGTVGGTSAGSSLLLALLAKLSISEELRQGCLIRFSPLAFAGWLGLFITALNLLPIGQLDGGHIARAMFGRRLGGTIGTIAMWSLLLLGIFVWPGLLTWAIIVFFIAGQPAPLQDDLTPVTARQRWLGYAAFVILLLILVPLPHVLWPGAGIHCPYVQAPQ